MRDTGRGLRRWHFLEWLLLVGCLASLLVVILRGVAASSDLLMLDMRPWRMSGESKREDLGVLESRRPLRLMLTPRGQRAAVAEHVVAVRTESPDLCFQVFVFSPAATEVATNGYRAEVRIDDEIAAAWPVRDDGKGALLDIRDIHPRRGGLVSIAFVVRGPAGAGDRRTPPTVAFEFATLRPCGGSNGRGSTS